MNKVATFIKTMDDQNATGLQKLYCLDPPLVAEAWDDDDDPAKHEYVVVSGTNAMFSGPETYIFPSNKNGEIVDWGELPGSYRGGLDHEEALKGAGYVVDDASGGSG